MEEKNYKVYNELKKLATEFRLIKSDDLMTELDNYQKLNKLNNEGILKKRLEETQIVSLFREVAVEFSSFLTSKRAYYYNKALANTSEFIKIFEDKRFNLMLCLYFEEPKAYKYLPLFYLECVKYYKLEDYRQDVEKIKEDFRKYFDITYFSTDKVKPNGEVSILKRKTKINEKVYEKYLSNPNYLINPDGKIMMAVDGEYMLYNDIIKLYRFKEIPEKNALWIAKDYFDGFGCDLLAFNNKTNIETLYEVKTGEERSILWISQHELEVAKESIEIPNTRYIYHRSDYHIDESNGPDVQSIRKRVTLIMDKETGLLLDAKAKFIDHLTIKDLNIFIPVRDLDIPVEKNIVLLYTIDEYVEKNRFHDRIEFVYPEEENVLKRLGRL